MLSSGRCYILLAADSAIWAIAPLFWINLVLVATGISRLLTHAILWQIIDVCD